MKISIGSAILIGMSLLFPPAGLRAQEAAWELLAGSLIRDECDFCDRIPIVRPLEGSFGLEIQPSIPEVRSCTLSSLDWRSAKDDGLAYLVEGTGAYLVDSMQGVALSLDLAVSIDGVEGIVLSGKAEVKSDPWPVIDIVATEPEPHRDPNHVFTIRLKAAPKAARPVAYGLLKESGFYDDCPPCAKPIVLIPIQGSFTLGVIEEGMLGTLYRVDGIRFQDTATGSRLLVTGGGTYWQGGEVALTQRMDLELAVVLDGVTREGALVSSDQGVVGAPFPELLVHVAQTNALAITEVITLDILAAPAAPPSPFRRGDANIDGTVDLSDAVMDLFWLYLGGTVPECLEAADADGNGQIELTDAVYLLTYLFLGGNAPPAPGALACGEAPVPKLGCARYPSCK